MNNKKPPKTLVLGIDTGGTYTDGVLLEYNTHRIIATHKCLTTKRDFSIGIENVIKEIELEDPSAIQMVSISTTLATNAIAEGKGKRVALFLIGYDPDLIDSFDMGKRFATPHYYYIDGGHDLHGQEKTPLDLQELLKITKSVKNKVDAIAVSSYFSPRNPDHEIRAQNAIASVCELPIVLGHQLSTSLGSVERATTASLNASLLAVLQEFIIAVRRAMENRGISAPLMVVRGDGTLMNDEFAAQSPVETIHSGPAASAIGGRFLSGEDQALVLDVGGTTTDLALIKDGKVTVSETGASVSGYQTAVKAANLFSIGLGGDSHITLERGYEIAIGPERVVPLAYLAHLHQNVRERLKALAKRGWPSPNPRELEYWFLQREVPASNAFTAREQQVLEILKSGPKPATEVLKSLGLLDPSQIDLSNLWREEITGKSGLTPTDILHVEGKHTPWDEKASQAALSVFSHYLNWEPDKFRRVFWESVAEKITKAVIHFLTEKDIPAKNEPNQALANWFLKNTLLPGHDQLETQIKLTIPLIGIGAPAEVMLEKTAQVFNTKLILPPHYQVANAAGAVAGSVMVTEEILIYPHLSAGNVDVIGYYLQARDGREEIEELEDALNKARKIAGENALSAALRSGADNPQVDIEMIQDGMDSYRIKARAVGKPRLEG
ncbi:MAG TPA: hydantoinase/oxoprolinase family protein [Chloroflexi bacterium]|nr:hydantoinase/oxoprolinase family protein [Chloroflexota bacterium]